MADALRIELGTIYDPAGGLPAHSNFALDQTLDALEVVFQAPEAITITRLGFRYGAKSTGVPPTYVVQLQGVDASGNPDGVIKGATNNARKTFLPPNDTSWNGTWQWLTLDEPYTCARGEVLAFVIVWSSGTISGTASGSFTVSDARGGARQGFPYVIQNNNGTRTRQTLAPTFGYGSASVAYGAPSETLTSTPYSSPTENGLTFTLPAAWGATYKVVGVRWFGQSGAAAKTMTVALYDADANPGTVLQSIQWDWDVIRAAGATMDITVYFDEATLATLTFGTTYHIGLLADLAATNMSLFTVDADAAADFAAWPGAQQFNLCSRSGGVWTEETARRPMMNLILADITEPAGGGEAFTGKQFNRGFN